ncbi:hypothetical protein OSB04_031685 [Centaurea solstitialis]|uniref:AP2/ERF domain-containing protein n=1 Tax=Centaurea solstitialis TaxID=347529 RepID=A0AA38VXT9_9ASTR|nr:hypothetical protein OSB04_031685 [Centaurea solstitialis]
MVFIFQLLVMMASPLISRIGYPLGSGDGLHSYSLPMSPSSSCVIGSQQQITNVGMDSKKRGREKVEHQQKQLVRKSLDTFGERTSQYRGVTRHKWTGIYETHLWESSCRKGQTRKERQKKAATRVYDLATLKYWGAQHKLILRYLFDVLIIQRFCIIFSEENPILTSKMLGSGEVAVFLGELWFIEETFSKLYWNRRVAKAMTKSVCGNSFVFDVSAVKNPVQERIKARPQHNSKTEIPTALAYDFIYLFLS